MHTPEEVVASFNKDQAHIMKGKRTKRPRLPLPLPSTTSSVDLANSSSPATTSSSPELRDSSRREEEEDMAHCLILLARGHAGKLPSSISHAKDETYVYQCKTCDRCFSSFQALGGHRASHKKSKPTLEEKPQVGVGHDYDAVSLQLSSTALCTNNYSSGSISNNNNNKSRVHECAICGAEFSSGQALGGHMRRHRNFVNASATASTSTCESLEAKKPRNVLKLDLNLPAPEHDDHHDHTDSSFPFHSKDVNLLVFSASPLVHCHY